MEQEKVIEPEIVDTETTKNNTGNNKKLLSWIWLAAAIIYAVSPLDLVSDVIPVAGWSDDLLLSGAAVTNFIQQNFLQNSGIPNKIFKILKMIFISLAVIIILISVLILTLIFK